MIEHVPGVTDQQRLNLLQRMEDIPGSPRVEAVAKLLAEWGHLNEWEWTDEFPDFDWAALDRAGKFHYRQEAVVIVNLIEQVDAGEVTP